MREQKTVIQINGAAIGNARDDNGTWAGFDDHAKSSSPGGSESTCFNERLDHGFYKLTPR